MVRALYEEYLKDLEEYASEPFEEGTAKEALAFYKAERQTHENKLIFTDTGLLAGFLIIGWAPDCHPDCDYFICQAYIKPEYRGRGLMTGAFRVWLEAHPGTYCLDVLFENHPARRFWLRRFLEAGYRQISLPFCEHGVTGVCETLFFRKSMISPIS